MRDAVRGVTPLRSTRMREHAYHFSVHFRVGRCLYRHAIHRKEKLKLRMIRSVKFYACGPIPRA
jgi:hypothetical protein